jgi:histidine ammonia-lyase
MRPLLSLALLPVTLLMPALVPAATSAQAGDRTWHPIMPRSTQTIALSGHELTLAQIVAIARDGARILITPDAQQRQQANYGLLLEAAAEGVPVYWFNRGAGDQRETVLFSGDPDSPANRAAIGDRQLRSFRLGATWGLGPEVADEEVVRAMMAVRANTMTLNAPSPQLATMLVELLNHRITPVVQSRGTVGEGDLAQLANVAAAMVGVGEVYYQGKRMPAARALRLAGLQPLKPSGADDNALMSSNAYATGQAALAAWDARRALQWADLIYAMDLNGMNSSITPLSAAVQCDRPDAWLNWDAARVLAMIRGSYLFNDDQARIIQDPESLRASSIRQGSAWHDWDELRAAVLAQANSSDHNPAVRVGLGPEDSWELGSAQMLRFYVKGGPLSHGQHGYVVSNANWDPYPMATRLESFAISLANMDVAVMSRIERFSNPFFTVVKAADVLPAATGRFTGYTTVALQQEISSLINPIAPFGGAIVGTVEDLQAQTAIKVEHVRRMVGATLDLLAHDLLTASLWMDVRKTQDAGREFGPGPAAVWREFRRTLPLIPDSASEPRSESQVAAQFVREVDPAELYPLALPPVSGSASQTDPRCP